MGKRSNDELDEEMRLHIQNRADDLERSGLSRGEAERRARIELAEWNVSKKRCAKRGG
jgi:hypothetical protein